MFIPAFGKSVADLDAATKNAHSHRARAAQMLALMHRKLAPWLNRRANATWRAMRGRAR